MRTSLEQVAKYLERPDEGYPSILERLVSSKLAKSNNLPDIEAIKSHAKEAGRALAKCQQVSSTDLGLIGEILKATFDMALAWQASLELKGKMSKDTIDFYENALKLVRVSILEPMFREISRWGSYPVENSFQDICHNSLEAYLAVKRDRCLQRTSEKLETLLADVFRKKEMEEEYLNRILKLEQKALRTAVDSNYSGDKSN